MRQMKQLEVEEERLANEKLKIAKDHEVEMAKVSKRALLYLIQLRLYEN